MSLLLYMYVCYILLLYVHTQNNAHASSIALPPPPYIYNMFATAACQLVYHH